MAAIIITALPAAVASAASQRAQQRQAHPLAQISDTRIVAAVSRLLNARPAHATSIHLARSIHTMATRQQATTNARVAHLQAHQPSQSEMPHKNPRVATNRVAQAVRAPAVVHLSTGTWTCVAWSAASRQRQQHHQRQLFQFQLQQQQQQRQHQLQQHLQQMI